MKALILLVAVATVTAAIDPPPPSSLHTRLPQREAKCIDGCKCTFVSDYALKITRCSKDISLTDTTFANLSMEKLNTIEFAGVVVKKIKDSAFDALKNIEVISFKNSRIDSFQEDAFDLPKLDKLSFNGCRINMTTPFINSDMVKELVVKGCNLKKMPEFGDMPSLETLDLSHNYIKNVSKDAFEELESLETLILSNNNITFLPPEVFYDNTALTYLFLDNNPFKFFAVSDESPIEHLSLSSCKLTTFDRSSTKFLTSVTYLNLSGNKIAMLPNDAFQNMTSLEFLDVSNNNLKHLDVSVFKYNKKLEKLILDNNHFTTLPPLIVSSGSFAISVFSCKHCEISSLSKDTFKYMPSIQILDLSENYFIENIEGVLKYIPSLVELDVSNNSITSLTPNTFLDNRNLRTLHLRGNLLLPINPKVFSNNKVLSLLDVSNTGLFQVWANNKTRLPSIKTLFISNNVIQKITPSDLEVTPNLKYLYMEKNKLKCDTDFKQSIKWLSDHGVRQLAEVKDYLRDYISSNWVKPWRELVKEVCPNEPDDGPPSKAKDVKQLYLEDLDDEEDKEEEDVLPEDDVLKPGSKEFAEYYYYYDEDEDVTSKPTTAMNRQDGARKSTLAPRIIQQDLDEYDELKLGPLEEFDLENKYTLTKTSYIVLVTSVFMLTALLVVIVTVSCTVLILKKNRNINLERANLPRFKIPLWSAIPAQKKHSGSVYQTLTEEYSAPKTPIISRYEFKSSPTVHNPSSA